MYNLPILDFALSAFCLLAYLRFAPYLRTFNAKMQPLVHDDYFNWTARDGSIYEDIETFFVQGDHVTFRHKFGTARVAISQLTDSARTQLIRRYQEAHPLSLLSVEEGTTREVGVFHSQAA